MFETLTQSRTDESVVTRGALPGALVAHGVALAFLGVVSLLTFVAPGGDPPIPWFPPLIVELAAPLGSPDGGGLPRHGPQAPAAVRERAPEREAAVVQPTA